jgi:uncharacterized membrane protein
LVTQHTVLLASPSVTIEKEKSMSSVIDATSTESIKKWATIHYLLHIAGIILSGGMLTLIALVLNYVKRDDANGTFVRSHMDYMISSWWKMILWTVILGAIMTVLTILTLGLGVFLWFIVAIPAIIFAIRMVLGLMKLSDNRPI